MKKFNYVALLSGAFALSLGVSVSADEHASDHESAKDEHANLTIDFVEPKSFTDIRAGNEPQGKYRDRVLAAFEEYFAELSEGLPQGQILEVSVTDIDLAGDTRSPRIPLGSTLSEVRVMEDIYWPRIKFSYTLKDAEGSVLQAEDVDLKDMSYLSRAGVIRGSREAFKYEYYMLSRWFDETFDTASESAS